MIGDSGLVRLESKSSEREGGCSGLVALLKDKVGGCSALVTLLEERVGGCLTLVALLEERVERVGGGSEVAACSYSLNCTSGGLSVGKCSKVHSISTL